MLEQGIYNKRYFRKMVEGILLSVDSCDFPLKFEVTGDEFHDSKEAYLTLLDTNQDADYSGRHAQR